MLAFLKKVRTSASYCMEDPPRNRLSPDASSDRNMAMNDNISKEKAESKSTWRVLCEKGVGGLGASTDLLVLGAIADLGKKKMRDLLKAS